MGRRRRLAISYALVEAAGNLGLVLIQNTMVRFIDAYPQMVEANPVTAEARPASSESRYLSSPTPIAVSKTFLRYCSFRYTCDFRNAAKLALS